MQSPERVSPSTQYSPTREDQSAGPPFPFLGTHHQNAKLPKEIWLSHRFQSWLCTNQMAMLDEDRVAEALNQLLRAFLGRRS